MSDNIDAPAASDELDNVPVADIPDDVVDSLDNVPIEDSLDNIPAVAVPTVAVPAAVETPKPAARPIYSGATMVVHQVDSQSFGVMTLSSGTYSVKASAEIRLEPGRITPVSPGVRLNLPRDIVMSLQLPKDAHRDLMIVNRDQSDRIGDRQHISNLTVYLYNTGTKAIKLRRGTPIATITTNQHQQIAIIEGEVVVEYQHMVTIPSTVFGYITYLVKQDIAKFINRYFADRDPMPDIREAADFKEDDGYLSSALFKAMSNEQREQIKQDYEQYKRQKIGEK